MRDFEFHAHKPALIPAFVRFYICKRDIFQLERGIFSPPSGKPTCSDAEHYFSQCCDWICAIYNENPDGICNSSHGGEPLHMINTAAALTSNYNIVGEI